MKLLFRLAFLLLSVMMMSRLYFALTDDFRLANIVNPSAIPLSQPNKPIPALFDQPYHYLAKGAQSYVFLSDDKQYVLKFFKFKHIKPSIFDSEKNIQRKERKLKRLFSGYLIAQKHDVPGLTYIHLQTGSEENPVVKIYDKLGLPRRVPLDQVVFVIQKAGTTFESEMSHALKKGDIDASKNLISKIFELYFSEYRQGIFDRDHRVMGNTGFTEGKAFRIDVGMLTESDTIAVSNFEDMEKVAYTIQDWLMQHFKKDASELAKYMERKLSEHYNRPFQFVKSYDEVLRHNH